MSNNNNIIKELKNRKVFRSLAIYAAFAFILIQVCSIVVPALLLPDWTMRLLVVLVIIGFPTTFVLSWIYDITPTSKVEKNASTETSKTLGIYAITGLVLTIIGIGFWVVVGTFGVTFGGNDEVPSIGILMMDNLGAEDDEFWSGSMTADLITKVAGAGLIRVAPIKDILTIDEKLSVEEIANKLRVRYLFTHSFHKRKDGFDLWYQLINTENGTTVLTNKISEPLDKTTQMVGMLANEIITSLDVSTKQNITKIPTNNAEAYEYYLKGKYKFEKRETLTDAEIARELLQKAIEIDNELIIAKMQLCETYMDYGEFDKAKVIYEEVLSQSEKLEDKKNAAISMRKIGNIYLYKNDYDKALDYYNRSIDVSELIDDKALIASCINNIGVIYGNKNNVEKQIEYFTRSIEIAKEIDAKENIAFTTRNLGAVYSNLGDSEKSSKYYNQALKIYEEVNDKKNIAFVLNGIGSVYWSEGDLDSALDYNTRALQIYEELGDKNSMAGGLNTKGWIVLDTGKYDKSLAYFTQALQINEEFGTKGEMASNLQGIGHAYKNLGDIEKSIDYLRQSLNLAEEFHSQEDLIYIHWGLGAIYGYQNIDDDKAMGYCNRALNLAEELNNKAAMRLPLLSIGIIYYHKGNYVKAAEYLGKSSVVQQELGYGDILNIWINTYRYLSYKKLGKEYEEDEIHTFIKETAFINEELNFRLYQLLEDTSYLETAYNQVQEKADNLESDVKATFLSYKIPKTIVEEWEKNVN